MVLYDQQEGPYEKPRWRLHGQGGLVRFWPEISLNDLVCIPDDFTTHDAQASAQGIEDFFTYALLCRLPHVPVQEWYASISEPLNILRRIYQS